MQWDTSNPRRLQHEPQDLAAAPPTTEPSTCRPNRPTRIHCSTGTAADRAAPKQFRIAQRPHGHAGSDQCSVLTYAGGRARRDDPGVAQHVAAAQTITLRAQAAGLSGRAAGPCCRARERCRRQRVAAHRAARLWRVGRGPRVAPAGLWALAAAGCVAATRNSHSTARGNSARQALSLCRPTGFTRTASHGGEPVAPQQGGHPLHVRHHPRSSLPPHRSRSAAPAAVAAPRCRRNLGRKPVRRREDPGLAEHLRVRLMAN